MAAVHGRVEVRGEVTVHAWMPLGTAFAFCVPQL